MEERTKKILKIVGGAAVGVGLLATGSHLLGGVIGISLIKSGKVSMPAGLSSEAIKRFATPVTQTKDILRAAACYIGGYKFIKEATTAALTKEIKVSIVDVPPTAKVVPGVVVS